MTSVHLLRLIVLFTAAMAFDSPARAQAPPAPADAGVVEAGVQSSVTPPADYVIGPEDVLGVLFWREEEMSGDVTVRPDGMITLPLLGDIAAAGLKPDALRAQVQAAVDRYLTDASVTVVVREIKSRQVFITGEVVSPGAYPLTGPRTIMQAIAIAGGLKEWADAENITVMRFEQGVQKSYRFNYNDVARGRQLSQNVQLMPGDTIVVP
ncbi:MAG: polysaccharide biosynthesis/export family protein [Vicinamibacterales bacterium]